MTPGTIDPEAARAAVAAALPYYCVPGRVYALDALPITSRGKVDKAALLQMAQTVKPAAMTEPIEATSGRKLAGSVA